ncbi:MAG: TonB-dependent receptor domain-containing protein [Rubricoccaceae bacterium]
MPRLLLALLALAAWAPAAAQMPGGAPGGSPGAPPAAALTARVLDDATGEPIPSATLALFQGEQFVTGAASAPNGTVTLSGLAPGTYTARFSFVGYARQERPVTLRPGPPLDLGTIRLVPDATVLGEVAVEARRQLVEQRADRTVYNVAEQPVTTGGSALETLQTLPALDVDTDGNVSLRGNQNVAIYLNGRPVPVRGATLAGILRGIPASQVERVEVIPNPSARYEASEMGGIINIVLKSGTNRGLAGSVTAGGGTQPNAELGGTLSYQRGRLDAYGTASLRRDAFDLTGVSTRQVGLGGQDPLGFDQDGTFANVNRSALATGSVDVTLREGLVLGLSGQGSARRGGSDTFTAEALGVAGLPPTTFRASSAAGDTRAANLDAAALLTRTFEPQRHTLVAEVRANRTRDDNATVFADRALEAPGGAPVGPESVTRNTTGTTTGDAYGRLDYVRPVLGGRLETGARLSWRSIAGSTRFDRQAGGTFVEDPARTDASDYAEAVQAAYVQAQRAFGPLDVQAGLRAERAERLFETDRAGTVVDDARTDLFPSAFVAYNFGPGTLLKASYSRRVNRPRAGQLNPFLQFSDPRNAQGGNPELRPEFTDSFELTAQALYFLTVTPFYRRSTDVIRPNVTVDADGVSVFRPTNFASDRSYGADVTLLMQLGGPRLRGMVSGSVFRARTEGGTAETGLASDGVTWSVRGGFQSQLRPGTSAQVFAFYRGAQEVPGGRVSPFAITGLGVSQQLLGERLTLAVRVNDLFSTSRFRFESSGGAEGQRYVFEGMRDPNLQQVSATLTYTFGQNQARRRPQPQQPQIPMEGGFGI